MVSPKFRGFSAWLRFLVEFWTFMQIHPIKSTFSRPIGPLWIQKKYFRLPLRLGNCRIRRLLCRNTDIFRLFVRIWSSNDSGPFKERRNRTNLQHLSCWTMFLVKKNVPFTVSFSVYDCFVLYVICFMRCNCQRKTFIGAYFSQIGRQNKTWEFFYSTGLWHYHSRKCNRINISVVFRASHMSTILCRTLC